MFLQLVDFTWNDPGTYNLELSIQKFVFAFDNNIYIFFLPEME